MFIYLFSAGQCVGIFEIENPINNDSIRLNDSSKFIIFTTKNKNIIKWSGEFLLSDDELNFLQNNQLEEKCQKEN